MCCTMSSCCWSAWSVCSLRVTFSFGCALFHLAIIGAQTPLLSLPVTKVIGPRELPLLDPPPLLLPPPHPARVSDATATAATPVRSRPLLHWLAIRGHSSQFRPGHERP